MAGREDDVLSLVDDLDKLDGTDYGDGPNDPADDGDDTDDTNTEDVDSDPSDDGDVDDSVDDRSTDRRASADDSAPPVEKDKSTPAKLQMLNNGLAQDEKGNLVDPQSGQIIARAGSERRLYEKSTRLQTAMKARDDEIIALKREIADTKFLNGVPERYGVNRDEVTQALELTVAFKNNPAAAARKVLEMALAAGYNVSQILGEGAQDSVEMSAVKRMLDERLAPLSNYEQQQQQSQREREVLRKAEQDMNDWMDSRPYSSVHISAIDKLIGENPSLSPDAAYYELRNFAEKNGLDFRQPLGPQVAALRQRGAQNQNRQQPRDPNPLPNGRRMSGARPMSDTEQVSPGTSWEDIIRSSMRN